MFSLILGLCFLFISTYFVYEKAKENGQSAFFWMLVNIFAFVCSYLVIIFITLLILGIAIQNFGGTANFLLGFVELINLLVLMVSATGFIFILRELNKTNGNKI